MKTAKIIMGLLLSSTLLLSCKDNEEGPAEQNLNDNHPQEIDSRYRDSVDTTDTMTQDTMMDPNMQGQSDTHGRDTDAGK